MKRSLACQLDSVISIRRFALVSLLVVLSFFSGISSSNIVTLESIEIFTTHEWLSSKPTVYFKCKGGNKTVLPDVKKKNFLYTFKDEESWQPLTELPGKKCQRCGLYEQDIIKHDDVYDEWELCPSDFVDGKYVHSKEKEFNATFLCPECSASAIAAAAAAASAAAAAAAAAAGSNQTFIPQKEVEHKSANVLVVVLISLLTSLVTAVGACVIYRYWQKRKREQDQARFLKLFDEGDDIEDELALGHL